MCASCQAKQIYWLLQLFVHCTKAFYYYYYYYYYYCPTSAAQLSHPHSTATCFDVYTSSLLCLSLCMLKLHMIYLLTVIQLAPGGTIFFLIFFPAWIHVVPHIKVKVKAVCGSYSTAALRHIVLLPEWVPPFISRGAAHQAAWETSASEGRNYTWNLASNP